MRMVRWARWPGRHGAGLRCHQTLGDFSATSCYRTEGDAVRSSTLHQHHDAPAQLHGAGFPTYLTAKACKQRDTLVSSSDKSKAKGRPCLVFQCHHCRTCPPDECDKSAAGLSINSYLGGPLIDPSSRLVVRESMAGRCGLINLCREVVIFNKDQIVVETQS